MNQITSIEQITLDWDLIPPSEDNLKPQLLINYNAKTNIVELPEGLSEEQGADLVFQILKVYELLVYEAQEVGSFLANQE